MLLTTSMKFGGSLQHNHEDAFSQVSFQIKSTYTNICPYLPSWILVQVSEKQKTKKT